ncbi:MAG: 23S rRNA (Uracil-5-)-methyltransferase RumA [Thermoanaerobacterales bacterium 50_218]|nr:MAG: 23S rRNA (Uracil-5-)-methyltransferase RumA [Thermoanaerobacterales bacterium 50_218]HAA90498.1 23S rRNA (uracil(1939)-C(5))-methyltransferase RlmD [Peptococcaceae bacterium]
MYKANGLLSKANPSGEAMENTHVVEITDYSHCGEGVGRIEGQVVFVPMAVRGELARVQVVAKKKNYLRGQLLEVLKPSSARVKPFCPLFADCGGCHLQHITYAEQLFFKEHRVKTALQRLGGIREIEVKPTLGMKDPWHYRHTARFHVGKSQGKVCVGFFRSKSHDPVPVTGCRILPPEFPPLLEHLSRLPVIHNGAVKEVVLRKSQATGEILVVFLAEKPFSFDKKGIDRLLKDFPTVTGIVAQVTGAKPAVIWGQGFYTEELAGLKFQIPATSFFQSNPLQAEVLISLVRSYATPCADEVIFDLYSGVGVFALAIARNCAGVYALEEDEEAVLSGKANARLNNINNITFVADRAENALPEFKKRGVSPQTIILDPPRAGSSPEVLKVIYELEPKKVVYISCNPATLARDLTLLVEKGYQPELVQPVDMFPQTYHIECVVLLKKSKP